MICVSYCIILYHIVSYHIVLCHIVLYIGLARFAAEVPSFPLLPRGCCVTTIPILVGNK